MRKTKYLLTLGLAARAGKVISGEMMAEKAIRSGNVSLLVLAEDASEGTLKKFRDHADYYRVPVIPAPTKEILGRSIGKDYRAMACVTDVNMASLIQKQYEADKA